MSSRQPTQCTHERRPGTTVCLQCRHEARVAAAARQKRVLRKLTFAAGGLVVVVSVVALAVSGLRRSPAPTPVQLPPAVQVAMNDDLATVTAPPLEIPALLPMVEPGRTELGQGFYVERTADTVVVHFDTPSARTRRRDKFEYTVRTTLRQVYGPGVDSLVVFPEEGALIGERDLLEELPEEGLQLPLASGKGALDIRPQTRPGVEGPLVIAYRAYLAR